MRLNKCSTTPPRRRSAGGFRSLSLALFCVAVALTPAYAWQFTENGSQPRERDHAFATAIDGTGDVIAGGQVVTTATGKDGLVVKLAAKDGTEVWRKAVDGPWADETRGNERIYAVAVDGDDDVIVAGVWHAADGGGHEDHSIVAKYDGDDGQELWFEDIGDAPDSTITSFVVDSAGDVHVVAGTQVVKLSGATGAEIWRGSPAGDFVVNSAGDVVVVGSVDNSGTGTGDDIAVSLLAGASGTAQWTMAALLPDDDHAFDVVLDASDDVLVAARLGGPSAAEGGRFGVVKFDGATGQELWNVTMEEPSSPGGLALTITADASGAVLVGGGILLSSGSDQVDPQFFVAKLVGNDGQELWRRLLPADQEALASSAGESLAIVVDANGDVVAGGFRQTPDIGDSLIVKFNGTDGTELWRDDGSASVGGLIFDLAVDADGHVAAAGETKEQADEREFLVVKLGGNGGTDLPCGDTEVDAAETCDDGNGQTCDGCTDFCKIELGTICGDGLMNSVCGEQCDDGANDDGDGCSADCIDQAAPENVSGTVSAGGMVTSDTEADGATPLDPVETSLTSPHAGSVSISESVVEAPLTTGFQLLSQQIDLSAPDGTIEEPIVVVFQIDASRVPADGAATAVEILRNDVPVGDCSGASGQAIPDPCIASRILLGDGDAQITALTSQTSLWTSGVVAETTIPISGTKMQIRDNDDPGRRKIVYSAKDDLIVAVDPRCGTGTGGCANLEVIGLGASGQRLNTLLPCANWKQLGKSQSPKGYKYTDGKLVEGPCKRVTVKRGRLKAICTGKNPANPLDYDLTPTGEAGVAVRLQTGPFVTYCSAFVGATGANTSVDDERAFKASKAPAPGHCFGGPVVGCQVP